LKKKRKNKNPAEGGFLLSKYIFYVILILVFRLFFSREVE